MISDFQTIAEIAFRVLVIAGVSYFAFTSLGHYHLDVAKNFWYETHYEDDAYIQANEGEQTHLLQYYLMKLKKCQRDASKRCVIGLWVFSIALLGCVCLDVAVVFFIGLFTLMLYAVRLAQIDGDADRIPKRVLIDRYNAFCEAIKK